MMNAYNELEYVGKTAVSYFEVRFLHLHEVTE
jgi:hypothetical protein